MTARDVAERIPELPPKAEAAKLDAAIAANLKELGYGG